ncbi:MAG: hypothetical protein WCT23_08065 [Candidatus Neomarinimicrobiota bacterium]|jgi:hypothetical protein
MNRKTQNQNTSLASWIFFVLMIISLLLLTSCLEYREELWLENDLSGRVNFDIGLPMSTDMEDEEILDLSIVSLCDSVEGIDVNVYNTYILDNNTWIHVELSFENILLLNEIENKWFGKFYILDEKDSRTLKRLITMSDTISVRSGQIANVLKYAMLGQYSWIYTMHFPDELYEVNAHIARTDTLSNTAVWEYNLASLINEQKTMMGRYRQRSGLNRFFQNIFK